MNVFAPELEIVQKALPQRVCGVVWAVRGLSVLVESLPLPIGSLVSVEPIRGLTEPMLGEVVGFSQDRAVVMLFGQTAGISAGDRVVGLQISQTVGVSMQMLGLPTFLGAARILKDKKDSKIRCVLHHEKS